MKSRLYLYDKSPYASKSFETILKMLESHANRGVKAGLVLLQDAVTGIVGEISEELRELPASVKVYALLEDAKARGLADLNSLKRVTFVNYRELVNLIVNEYDHIVNYL
ncbi:MAG: sulfurtransferase complex subunit TusB [Candidatus Odinarchaeum yellowstonii]|uniref:Sulfurtransferase complex subunit TusB n=1 Tax=Odinarchaeota yellowstonii (strain LCB_4) TaxID=1841599 RepID=A0AAF0D1N6_ODILC|nr:MAG: sulfurtransferase complex subunit TusB [Candidatus Odinarchaeum yellowstonii]